MKKSKLINIFISMTALFGIYISLADFEIPQTVQAARLPAYVRVKGKENVRLYKANGKHSRYFAAAKKKYACRAKKYLKIGKKGWLAYRIGNNSQWLLKKNAVIIKKSKIIYQQATMKMPAAYTKAALLAAYQGRPSAAFIRASMQGMSNNSFSRGNISESKADDMTMINPANLTPEQNLELARFSLRLINEARADLALRPWVYSTGTQKLADDIASEYTQNNKSIKDGHYVAGIVRACKANGLNLDDNYIEDMAGFYDINELLTMTQMKKNIYFGLKQMLFGYSGSGESGRNKKKFYREWEHAGDLFNTQGSLHDGDYNYYGFSISRTDNVYSLHYINVAAFIVKSKKYNIGFKP